METEVERPLGDLPALGETVHDPAHLAGALLGHDPERVLRRLARMDDERLARFAGCADVPPETLVLPGEVAFAAVVVEAGLADRDHPRVVGQPDQVLDRGIAPLALVRVHANGGVDVGIGTRDREQSWQTLERDRDAEHMADAVLPGPREDRGDISA